jgi:ribosomal protein S14
MAQVKNFYHDELEARRANRDGHCGQCGDDADTDTEAWSHGLCRDCFNEANGQFGVGA